MTETSGIKLPEHEPHPGQVCCRWPEWPNCCIDCPSLGYGEPCRTEEELAARVRRFVLGLD